MLNEKQLQKLYEWRVNPGLFVREALGATPLPWQDRLLAAVADPANNRISVKSAHGVGKSTVLAWLSLWFIATRKPVKVGCTAPTGHQLEDVLRAEFVTWLRKAPGWLQAEFSLGVEKISITSAPEEGFIAFRTSRKEQPEAFQGLHSKNMLLIADEASGVHDAVFEAGQGVMSTPGSKLVMASNPTRTQGYFFDSQTRLRGSYHCITVSYFELKGTALYSQEFVDDMKARYGENSNAYRIRVLGEFPTGDDDSVVPFHLAQEAVGRDVRVTGEDPIVWGLDVARFGDDRTCLAKRKKNKVLEPVKSWHGLDLMQTAGMITAMYRDTDPKDRPDEIMIDSIGLGSGVLDRLRENGLPVRGVNVSEASSVNQKYFRLRDELWFAAREFFEDRACSIPDDQELITEITTPKYSILSSGKLQVEPKSDVKKRTLMKQSPDKADALILTFASMKMKKSFWGAIDWPTEGAI